MKSLVRLISINYVKKEVSVVESAKVPICIGKRTATVGNIVAALPRHLFEVKLFWSLQSFLIIIGFTLYV